MPVGAHITAERRSELRRAMVAGGVSIQALAKREGVARNTLVGIRQELFDAGLKALEANGPAGAVEPPTPVEVHDTAFWRRRARALEREQGEMQRVVEEMGGIRNMRVEIPPWAVQMPRGRKGRAVIGLLVSDVHDGEVINAEEINGVNEFNPDICEKRLTRYFEASCLVAARWANDCNVEGALVALAGDMTSGDIHEELTRTNALTAHEQVHHVVALVGAGLKRVKEAFGKVHVVSVPGNHGRPTHKPTAKLYSTLSYDTLIAAMLADQFKNDPAITFQFGRAKDQLTPVFGRTILTTHFDKIGTRGGQGFAGPMLPIIRGAKKIIEQQGSVGRHPDLIQGGHYHSTGNPYLGPIPILANGSVPGVSEYADDLRVAVEPPQQWTYLLHDRWWLRERQPIILTDLVKPEMPRVRIPAGMARG